MSNQVPGKNVFAQIKVDGVFYPIFCAKEATFTTVQEEIETTSVNSGAAREYVPGMQSTTVDVTGLTTISNTGGRIAIIWLLQATQRRTIFEMRWLMTDSSGTPISIEFSGFSTTLSISRALAGAFSQSGASFRVTGNYSISDIIPPPVPPVCEIADPLYMDVTPGATSVDFSELAADGVEILSVVRTGDTLSQTTGTPGSLQFKWTSGDDTIFFDPTNPFNAGEFVAVLYKVTA